MSKCTRLPVEGKRITWWDIWNIMGIVTVWQRSRLGLQLFCCLGWSFPNVINESKTSHPRIVLLAEIAQKRSSSQWKCLCMGRKLKKQQTVGADSWLRCFSDPRDCRCIWCALFFQSADLATIKKLNIVFGCQPCNWFMFTVPSSDSLFSVRSG